MICSNRSSTSPILHDSRFLGGPAFIRSNSRLLIIQLAFEFPFVCSPTIRIPVCLAASLLEFPFAGPFSCSTHMHIPVFLGARIYPGQFPLCDSAFQFLSIFFLSLDDRAFMRIPVVLDEFPFVSLIRGPSSGREMSRTSSRKSSKRTRASICEKGSCKRRPSVLHRHVRRPQRLQHHLLHPHQVHRHRKRSQVRLYLGLA